MGQTSRIVTIIDGIEVIEVTLRDEDGDRIEAHYQVGGENHETLRKAMEEARKISESR